MQRRRTGRNLPTSTMVRCPRIRCMQFRYPAFSFPGQFDSHNRIKGFFMYKWSRIFGSRPLFTDSAWMPPSWSWSKYRIDTASWIHNFGLTSLWAVLGSSSLSVNRDQTAGARLDSLSHQVFSIVPSHVILRCWRIVVGFITWHCQFRKHRKYHLNGSIEFAQVIGGSQIDAVPFIWINLGTYIRSVLIIISNVVWFAPDVIVNVASYTTPSRLGATWVDRE